MGSIRVCAMISVPENRYTSVTMYLSYDLESVLSANVPSNIPEFGDRGSELHEPLIVRALFLHCAGSRKHSSAFSSTDITRSMLSIKQALHKVPSVLPPGKTSEAAPMMDSCLALSILDVIAEECK
jgi:hypothetical protein